ncbi:Hypothetical predicted protein [Octopus vulgaris]|uniref:Uncharacterized protein n=1 Tax=Octopus vulgaris TaxID=6645 RepID=A0AA36APF7_OCTVU|nr:Hypothetical predicted protein [Octopus vulgaris]
MERSILLHGQLLVSHISCSNLHPGEDIAVLSHCDATTQKTAAQIGMELGARKDHNLNEQLYFTLNQRILSSYDIVNINVLSEIHKAL